jgi:hypothetical protein
MQPRPHVANGTIVKSVTGLSRSIHVTDSVHKPLDLRMAHRLTQDSHGHKRKFERHAGQCSKASTAKICVFAGWVALTLLFLLFVIPQRISEPIDIEAIDIMCHPDRSAAEWRDLLFVWVGNLLRVAVTPTRRCNSYASL